jgi:hypothetical protein
MKPFVWVTAFLLALLFLAGAALIGIDAVNDAEFLTSPKTKIAAGWLMTGLIFLSLGYRGWKSYRRRVHDQNRSATGRLAN